MDFNQPILNENFSSFFISPLIVSNLEKTFSRECKGMGNKSWNAHIMNRPTL